ncbi:uncharacterized protein SOCEGT47_069740 [Sorangium cellulosum]|uniref:Uncharacterized protein n=1 Tax=Sorangium cellulosum TaxID=56 RepID=A0A4P2QBC6_SORCE|nr:hypothetical protein [Sorangium cellulosum]AUX26413.1 uncharacterized protein SOCEGT47_069740 [Sorangium cellulosum]
MYVKDEALRKRQEVLHLDAVVVTKLLWETYRPCEIGYAFAAGRQTTPSAIIARATRRNPATFAPTT